MNFPLLFALTYLFGLFCFSFQRIGPLFFIGILSLFILGKVEKLQEQTPLRKILPASLIILSGLFFAYFQYKSFDSQILPKESNTYLGQVLGTVDRKGKPHYICRIQDRKQETSTFQARVLIKSSILDGALGKSGAAPNLEPGDNVFLSLVLQAFEGPGLVGDFDERRYYQGKGISSLAYVKDARLYEKASPIWTIPTRLRSVLEKPISELPPGSRDFLGRVLLGSSYPGDPGLEDQMKALGLAHLLAASGLHIGLIYQGALRIFSFLPIKRRQLNVLVFILLFLYAWALSFPASILRAYYFLLFNEVARQNFRKLDRKKRWTFSLFFLLLLRPFSIYDLGLHLSFLCSFAMDLSHALNRWRPLESKILQSFRFSFWINILTLPVLGSQIGSFSLASFISNLLIVPLFNQLFLLGLTYILLSFLPLLGPMIAYLFHGIFTIFQLFIQALSSLEIPNLENLVYIKGSYWLVFYLIFFLFYFYRKNKYLPIKAAFTRLDFIDQRTYLFGLRKMALAVLGLILSFFIFINQAQKLRLFTMVNVGQGDSFLLQTQDKNILFDTGGKLDFKTMENIQAYPLSQELKHRGLEGLDAIFISHQDYDHMGNLVRLSQILPIGKIYLSPSSVLSQEDLNLLPKPLIEEGRIIPVRQGQKFFVQDQFEIQVLDPGQFDSQDRNNHSMILLLDIGPKILLMGDGEEQEEILIGREETANIDILKLAHHGSRKGTSQAFLSWTKPSLALISVGYENAYGHPHQEVLDRLSENQISYLRTDYQGSVSLAVDPLLESHFFIKKQGLKIQPLSMFGFLSTLLFSILAISFLFTYEKVLENSL